MHQCKRAYCCCPVAQLHPLHICIRSSLPVVFCPPNRILLKSQSGPVEVYLLRPPRCPGPPQPAVEMPHPREVRADDTANLLLFDQCQGANLEHTLLPDEAVQTGCCLLITRQICLM
jgi:hypothetical protein